MIDYTSPSKSELPDRGQGSYNDLEPENKADRGRIDFLRADGALF